MSLPLDSFLGVSGSCRQNSSLSGDLFFFFNEINKTAERQCSFLPLREQGFDSNISEQMFRQSPNVFIWWHKDSVIHEMVC